MVEWTEFALGLTAILATLSALVSMGLMYRQTKHSQKSVEADMLLRLKDRFHHDKKMQEISARMILEKPILEENGGTMTQEDLIVYLGIITDVERLIDMGLLSIENVYDLFSVFLEDLKKNKEIIDYIKDAQKEQGEDTWAAIDELMEAIKEYEKNHN